MEEANPKRIQKILDDLDLTFLHCKFIYTPPGDNTPSNLHLKKRRGTLKDILNAVEEKFEEFSGTAKEKYESCTFAPGIEDLIKKQISTYETEHMKFRFIRCKFVKRESTIIENFVRRLRKTFGIKFELNFFTGAAEIEGSKFKIKDIPDIVNIVVERIQDGDD